MMGVHMVKGLWLGVIKGMRETSLRVNQVKTNLRSKSRRRKDIQYYKCGKKGHIKLECA